MGYAREGYRPYIVVFWALLLIGCGRHADTPYPEWSSRPNPISPQSGSNNAWDGYALAALDAERDAVKYLHRVSFTPDRKRNALESLAKALNRVLTAYKNRCEFQFTPSQPFDAPKYQEGWRLIGRAFVWKIQEACEQEDYDQAIRYTTIATKFGFDLTGGGATDASLGLTIVNEARQAIAPYSNRFQNTQLAKLSDGLTYALKNKPPLDKVIDHEELNMMAAIQYVQDCYRSDRTDDLLNGLGAWSRQAVKALKELKAKDAKERPAYFEGMSRDAKTELNWIRRQVTLPVVSREKEPDLGSGSLYWRFSRAFFTTLRPLLEMDDATVARTRLTIILSKFHQASRLAKPVPADLHLLPNWISTDPYSGKMFVYRSEGPDFDVYSVGINCRDDGGDTDESYSSPDLRSELQLR